MAQDFASSTLTSRDGQDIADEADDLAEDAADAGAGAAASGMEGQSSQCEDEEAPKQICAHARLGFDNMSNSSPRMIDSNCFQS